jgi:hypothetical protein
MSECKYKPECHVISNLPINCRNYQKKLKEYCDSENHINCFAYKQLEKYKNSVDQSAETNLEGLVHV